MRARVAFAIWVPLSAVAILTGARVLAEGRLPAQHTVSQDGSTVALRSPLSQMVKFNAGTFEMGTMGSGVLQVMALCAQEPFGHRCRANLFEHEGPSRKVELSAFWLDRHEVTVAQYRRCVSARICSAIPYDEGARRFDRPDYPVSLVTWDEARRYCEFRGARLPTEAEFERAARGQSARVFPWGDLYNSHASNHGRFGWYAFDTSDGFAELAPVGSFPDGATAEGILDLAGNVAEWVYDRYAPSYDPEDTKDPEGPPPGNGATYHVVRGGSYGSAAPWLRGAARDYEEPNVRKPSIGFRCARSASRVATPSTE